MTQVTLNGHTYSDDGTTSRDMLNGGAKVWFFPLVSDTLIVVGQAATSASAAAISAATAAAGAAALNGTSLSSVTIGTGSKSFATQPGKLFTVGAFLTVASSATPGAYMIGQVTAYNSTTGALVANVTDIGTAGTFASWNISISGPRGATGATGSSSLVYEARTSNTVLSAADKFKFIDCTGTFTQTFNAGASLGIGWSIFMRNSGTGDITLDPNGSEAIDNRTSYPMMDGETRYIVWDGANFQSVVLSAFMRTYIASGNAPIPPGYRRIQGLLWGAGGSGRKDSATGEVTTGGGGGACAPIDFDASTLSATEAFTIGAGGAARTTNATSGAAGGSSSFKTVTAFGGSAGATVTIGTALNTVGASAFYTGTSVARNSVLGYAAGDVVGSNVNAYYGGVTAGVLASGGSMIAVYTVYGGQLGGCINGASTLYNAWLTNTIYGGAGGAASLASSGADGVFPGGGGGATRTGAQSGAGAGGKLQYWGVI